MEISYCQKQKTDKKINIDKYLEIDKYVDEYTDITNGKITLVQYLLKQQSKFRMRNLKQKENFDIKTLETMHETLEKVLIKWVKTISKIF